MQTIRVHQIWLQGKAAIPKDISTSMQSWIEATKGRDAYEYVFWDDASIRDLLQAISLPGVMAIYNRVPKKLHGIHADIARLAILFSFGGLYADADTRVLRPNLLLDYFERALQHEGHDVVVGTADLCGVTRRWIAATRTPSNFLLACRSGSPFIGTYLRSIVKDFEALRLGDDLDQADGWSRSDQFRFTQRWTGPQKLRRLLKWQSKGVEMTPVGFIASSYQKCFPKAALAHDYKGNWYPSSKIWKGIRDRALCCFLGTPWDALIAVLVLVILSFALTQK